MTAKRNETNILTNNKSLHPRLASPPPSLAIAFLGTFPLIPTWELRLRNLVGVNNHIPPSSFVKRMHGPCTVAMEVAQRRRGCKEIVDRSAGASGLAGRWRMEG
jgi:hypothetical protein